MTTIAPTCAIPAPEETVPEAELIARATAAREALGDRLVILGHHYQKHEVIRFADITGDSFLLARRGAEATQADLVVFLGVYFMAEAADILAGPHQQTILPNMEAGCSMADMADIDAVEEALLPLGAKPVRREGRASGRWVLIDFGDIVLQAFHEEDREFYDLERLWGQATRLTFPDL